MKSYIKPHNYRALDVPLIDTPAERRSERSAFTHWVCRILTNIVRSLVG